MKKFILSISAVLFLLGIISFAIFSKSESRHNPLTQTEKNENPIELIFGHHMPVHSVLHETAVRFSKEIARKTKGRVTVKIYPNQELGNSHQMVELSRLGKIDILVTPTAKMSVAVPSLQYADLPFLFPTREDAYALLDGKVGELLLKEINKIDLLGVTFLEGGFKQFTANKPLLKVEDFKDQTIRVMKSRIIMEQFNALLAKTVTIDFHSVKKALKDGVVDGQENPLGGIAAMGFYDVQHHLTLSDHAYLAYVLTFSQKTFSNSL